MRVEIARVYDDTPEGLYEVLVDRLWPRGLSKSAAHFDLWVKDVAPSTELRKWYGHVPERFAEFARRYRRELAEGPAGDALEQLSDLARTHHVALVTATRDIDRSAAAVLKDVLAER
jgi:uncharacterized protein YeaO (DUF488 family)